jgi:AraC-like DNA-binding protein
VKFHYEVNGLVTFREAREGSAMPAPHSHNEIEVLLIERGGGTWLMGGEELRFEAGRLAVFWALRPHQLLRCEAQTLTHGLTIPLAAFQGWGMSEALSKHLLDGDILVEPDKSLCADDLGCFQRWHGDLASSQPDKQKLALLEIRARLGRLAIRAREHPGLGIIRRPAIGLMDQGSFQRVSQMAAFVAGHFAEPINVVDIAASIGMTPSVATRTFKRYCGINLVQYLTQHRLLHAQSLLASTDMKVADVAGASGYKGAIHFHAVFKKFCGVSPHEFRAAADFRRIPHEKKGGCSAALEVPVST